MPINTNIHLKALENMIFSWIATDGMKILVIIAIAGLLVKFVDIFVKKLMNLNTQRNEDAEYYKKMHTIYSITKSLLKVTILAVAFMSILQQIGINIGPILAAAGVLGVAVGFGSQRFVEDIIGGAIILIHNQIRVGDIVKIGDKSGLVEKITLNMITLRDNSGSVHFIRTGKLDVITNMTKDFSYYVLNIGVSYNEDIEKVMGVLKELGDDLQKDPSFSKDILEPIEILGIDQFAESSIIIQAKIKTRPLQQWNIGREFNLRMKKKFDELGIQMPSPQHEVRIIKGD